MSTTPPALGDIQKQIQDKVAQIRARITDLKTKLPFTPPGILPTPILPTSILSRTSKQGRLGNLGILSGNILKRPLLMRGSTCPGCSPQNMNPAIVDVGPTRVSPSGAAVSEEIDPTRRFGLSIAT